MEQDPSTPDAPPPARIAGRFAPGVSGNPRGRQPKRVVRHDGYTNTATGHGTTRDRRTLTGFRVDIVTDLEALQLRRSQFLCKRIIEALPEEAYRRGWSLKLDDKEVAERTCAQAEDLNLDEVLVEAAQKEREAGGAAIFPVLAGAQGDLSTPLRPRAIGSVLALHVLEPRELQPAAYYEDLRHPKRGLPSLYWFTPIGSGRSFGASMQMIHESRLVIFPGARVSKEDQPGQRNGWGDSALTPAKEVLADFGLSWGSAATLLHEHGLGTLEMDGYADLMATAEGEETVWRRLSGMMMAKSTLRALVIDGKDKYTRAQGALSGLAEVLNEFKQVIAGAAETPVSILLGMAQSGLRAGDDDTRAWYATVEKRRAKRYRPRHEQLLRLLFWSGDGPTRGEEPKVWSVEYPSLLTPSEKETAETRKTDMERAKIAIEAGIASADDVAESFYEGDTYSGDIRINWERRRAQAKIDAERAEDFDDDDLEAMGADEVDTEAEEEIDDEDLAELEAEDTEEDEEGADSDREDGLELREDKATGGGKGYNPYRAKGGQFAPGPRKKKPASPRDAKAASLRAKEAEYRRASIALKPELSAAKRATRTGTPKQRAAAERRYRKLAAKRDGLRGKAAAAKNQRGELQLQGREIAGHAKAARQSAKEAVLRARGARAALKADPKNKDLQRQVRETNAASKAARAAAERAKNAKTPAEAVKHAETAAVRAAGGSTAKPKPMTADAFEAHRDGFAKKLTADEQGASLTYSGDSYRPINGALRSGKMPDGYETEVRDLDSAIAKSSVPHNMLVYRGAVGLEATKLFGGMRPGDRYRDDAFTSTSADPNAAFSGDVMFVIGLRKGQKAAPIPSASPKEREMLLPRGSEFQVSKREVDEFGVITLHVDLV